MAVSFTFVPVEGGKPPRGAAITAEDRIKIRSAAASNPRSRSPAIAGPKKSRVSRRSVLISISPCQRTKRTRKDASLRPFGDLHTKNLLDLLDVPGRVPWTEELMGDDEEDSVSGDELDLVRNCTRPTLPAKSFEDSVLSKATRPGWIKTDRIDPFWTLSIPHRPLLSALIHHRAGFLCPRVPDLDGDSGENKSLESFKFGIDDPAFLYSALLIAAAHLMVSSSRDTATYALSRESTAITSEDLTWLRGCAASAIIARLRKNPMPGDTIIGAVKNMVIYEGMFGSRDACATHLGGFRKLVAMRGGLDQISPHISGLIRWQANCYLTFRDVNGDHQFAELPRLRELSQALAQS